MTLTPAQLLEWLTDRAQQQRNEARSFENAPWVGAGSAALFCREEADTLDAIAALLQHVEALEARLELYERGRFRACSCVCHEDGEALWNERDQLRAKVEALTQERNQLLGELCFVHGRDIPETEAAARAVLVKRAHDAEAERDRLQGKLVEARKAREQAERCARADDNSEHRGRSAKFYGDDNGFGGHR
jgi:hypothetical protein